LILAELVGYAVEFGGVCLAWRVTNFFGGAVGLAVV